MKRLAVYFGLSVVIMTLTIASNSVAYAQSAEIQVTPGDYDFGNMQVGESATTVITIANVSDDPLLLHSISLMAGSDQCFSFTIPDKMILEPANGHLDTTEMEVTFSPLDSGQFSAILVIYNSDPYNKYFEIPLFGAVTGQESSIDNIIAFFDESVEAETLYGITGCHHKCKGKCHHKHKCKGKKKGKKKCKKKGKCDQEHKCKCKKAALMRLALFRKMLVAAKYALETGYTQWACFMLKTDYLRSDGQHRPRDYVDGQARPELAGMILSLRDQLSCQY